MFSTQLKLLALVTMFIDHIGVFIPGAPVVFRIIGRVSFPIFLYCCILGYTHTSDRVKYLKRIYILNFVMAIVDYVLQIQTSAIRIILITLAIVFIYEEFKKKSSKRYKYVMLMFSWQVISSIILLSLANLVRLDYGSINFLANLLLNIIEPGYNFLFAILGLLMYMFKDSKIKLSLSFVTITGCYMVLFNTLLIPKLTMMSGRNHPISFLISSILYFLELVFNVNGANVTTDIFYGNPQWLMIIALIPILLYNGQKGKGLKYLFYVFYPLHIVILYLLGHILSA